MNELLHEILAAREQRVQKQQQLLDKHAAPLLCFTMNIPGPVKFDRDVSIGFHLGNWLLKESLKGRKVLHFEANTAITGCETYCVVDMPAKELKKLAVELEEIDPIGRLFDMDVLTPDGQKISREDLGYPRRKCLLCDQDAYICAGRRTHSADQLRRQAGFYLYIAAREFMCEYIATRAYFALNQEVTTTPKPGLVDGNNTGAHKDMDIRHFFASANALRPYFCDCAEQGFLTRDLPGTETLAAIRPLGLEAEQTMLKATRGVNTHKGAIFSLGILCAALGRLSPDLWQPERLLAECAAIAEGIADRDFAGITTIFDTPIATVPAYDKDGKPMYDANGKPVMVKGMIDKGGFDFSKTEDDLYILAALEKNGGDEAKTIEYLKEIWGDSYEQTAEEYQLEDDFAGIYHGKGKDYTAEMKTYLNQMITTGPEELRGCVPMTERLGEILQLLMDKYTFENVDHAWTKLCYYYDYLGPEA